MITEDTVREAFNGIFANSNKTDIERAIAISENFLSKDAWGDKYDNGVLLYTAYNLYTWMESAIAMAASTQQVHQGEYSPIGNSGNFDFRMSSNPYYLQFQQLQETINITNPEYGLGLLT